jgi:hypothetical protein
MVEAEESTKPVSTDHLASAVHGVVRDDQGVVEPLMVPFSVIVLDILGDRPSKMPFTQRYNPVKTLTLDRQNESLGECVGVGRRLHLMRTMRVKPFG